MKENLPKGRNNSIKETEKKRKHTAGILNNRVNQTFPLKIPCQLRIITLSTSISCSIGSSTYKS